MRGLTTKQAQVLACIQARMQRRGQVPSYREIAAHLGVTVRAAYQHVRALERKGVLSTARRPRGIRLSPDHVPPAGLPLLGRVAAGTQSQALSAILYLYQQDIGWIDGVVRAKQPQRVPVVLTQDEGAAVLRHLSGTTGIMATLLYGAGLRLMECLRLRVKDIDFSYNQIVVHDGNGHQDRVTRLPQQIKAPLQRHLNEVKTRHTQDLQAGAGHVYLPYALERTYPHASRAWAWPYVFPAAQLSRDPRTGIIRRHHVHTLVLQRGVQTAGRKAEIPKAASGHTLRHSCATHLLEAGYDIRTVQA